MFTYQIKRNENGTFDAHVLVGVRYNMNDTHALTRSPLHLHMKA